jgi:hypothetical protein
MKWLGFRVFLASSIMVLISKLSREITMASAAFRWMLCALPEDEANEGSLLSYAA